MLGNRLPTYEDLPNLSYTEKVFAETLRLYPPAWAMGRMVLNDTRIYNYQVPHRAICLLSPYVMQRHPRYYPDPERFDPERFSPEAKQSRPKFAYFPFGGGPQGVHRGAVCLDGRRAPLSDDRTALEIRSCPEPNHRDPSADHTSNAGRREDGTPAGALDFIVLDCINGPRRQTHRPNSNAAEIPDLRCLAQA